MSILHVLMQYVSVGNCAGDTLGVRLSCRGMAANYFRICTSVIRPMARGIILPVSHFGLNMRLLLPLCAILYKRQQSGCIVASIFIVPYVNVSFVNVFICFVLRKNEIPLFLSLSLSQSTYLI